MFILFLCITIVFAIIMLYTICWYMRKKDISALTSEICGEIVKVTKQDYKDPDSGEDKTVYTLKIAYSVNGRQYKTEMRTYGEEISFQEGQSVTVLYDENKPHRSMIKGDKQPQMLWRNYLVAAIMLFVISAAIFIITIPSTLGFSKEHRRMFRTVMHAVFFLIGLAGIIVYPRTREYKTRREEGG